MTVKNSVYALPAVEQTQEDFEWLLREITDGGGEGMICEAHLLDDLSDEDVRSLFNKARSADYDELSKEAQMLAATLDGPGSPDREAEARGKVIRLRAELGRLVAIDFFGADGRETAYGLLAGIEERLCQEAVMIENAPTEGVIAGLRGRVWVTRRGVHVDRIASAWLDRRFIDPAATFKFVPAKGYTPAEGELRFDMFEGEFTHEGDNCTFEVLMARAGLLNPALAAIGEIIHDIDLKDAKFGRVEASGIARVMDSIAAANKDDARRLDRGAAVLDDLYELFRSER